MKGLCDALDGGWFLPLSEEEKNLDPGVRGLLYALAMLYFFLGISMIADIFMNSIDTVTSCMRKRRLTDGRLVTEKVWDDTVATLSLMALGSSAPEIFLAVLDIFRKGMHSGDLGPSTISGSAAFNLFVIVAVCIFAIPEGEVRQIKEVPTFVVTACFSVGAYMWLVFILNICTPSVVDPWEAVATFLGLPMLIWVSYSTNNGIVGRLLQKVFGQFHNESEQATEAQCKLSFAAEQQHVKRSSETQTLEVVIMREGSHSEKVSCSYRTERFSAVPGYDYGEAEGTVVFPEGVDQQTIKLEILAKGVYRTSREFLVILENPTGGAELDPEADGGEESAILTVTIDAPPTAGCCSNLLRQLDAAVNIDGVRCGNADWAGQLRNWVYCNGSREEQREASGRDWTFHIIALPWKFLFSLVPPPSYFGGWLCFVVSISLIGLLTAVVSDLAELFGCVLEIPDIVTAITFVALGTSMPDLFASLSAAKEDPTADASIVNVTGSNSVNVFLGLGLPWTIASIHWAVTNDTEEWKLRYPEISDRLNGHAAFVVESRNLGFSVLVFSGSSVLAIAALLLRRKWIGGELGGPFHAKVASAIFFVLLWCNFVSLTSWRVLRCAGASPGHFCKAAVTEQMACMGSHGTLVCIASILTLAMLHTHQMSDRKVMGPDPRGVRALADPEDTDGWPPVSEVRTEGAFTDVGVEQVPQLSRTTASQAVTTERPRSLAQLRRQPTDLASTNSAACCAAATCGP